MILAKAVLLRLLTTAQIVARNEYRPGSVFLDFDGVIGIGDEVIAEVARDVMADQLDPKIDLLISSVRRRMRFRIIDRRRSLDLTKKNQGVTVITSDVENLPGVQEQRQIIEDRMECIKAIQVLNKGFTLPEIKVFESYFLGDKMPTEIARESGMSRSRVRTIVSQVRKKMERVGARDEIR